MNCEAVKEMLWAYLEKEITAEEAVKIEEHLKNCEACREELKFQQEMMETLSGLPDEELPEGYHTELMQKLQVEAASNVVPFPVRKKKQPVWKQWGMVAAAVLVVVAAGGMNGMLEMRESQNAAVQEMQAADVAAPVEEDGETFAAYNGAADDMSVSENSKKAKMVVTSDVSAEAYDSGVVYDEAEEKEVIPFAIARVAEVQITDMAVLTSDDVAEARAGLQKAITIAEGYEEPAAEENMVVAVIPVETFDSFVADMEMIGILEWSMQGTVDENTAFRTIEIRLK